MNKFQDSLTPQPSALTRKNRRMMMKIFRESKAFPCSEFDFDRCINCHRVMHHFDELCGIADSTDGEFYEHHGNQPLIFTSMTFEKGAPAHWNGLLHFTTPDADATRAFVKDHAKGIKVVLAYEDAFTGLYHFVVDTLAEDLTDENFHLVRKHFLRLLKDNVKDLTARHYNYYVRVLPEECYEIINRDLLFGKLEPVVKSKVEGLKSNEALNLLSLNSNPKACVESLQSNNSQKNFSVSLLNNVKTFVSRLFA